MDIAAKRTLINVHDCDLYDSDFATFVNVKNDKKKNRADSKSALPTMPQTWNEGN